MAHHLARDAPVIHTWDGAAEPRLTVASGETVTLDLVMAGHGQMSRGMDLVAAVIDWSTLYHLAGPIAVEGARPGQTLRVDIASLTPGPWGWTSILPELGLLPEEFPDAYLRTFELTGEPWIEIAGGVRAPVQPFLGTMGVMPGPGESTEVFPPHRGGGNVDCRHLVAGATLWLPIWQAGAMFACGDPHAAQGDGEVCVSAVECDMTATLRLTVEDRTIKAPMYRSPAGAARGPIDHEHLGTMGIDPDLLVGARKAVSAMVGHLAATYEIDPRDAYVACSLAGDLRVHEVVDAGVWNVGFAIPTACLPDGPGRGGRLA